MLYEEEIIKKMIEYFADDQERINHALKVTNYANQLIELYQKNNPAEEINPEVIIYSAILHDIGIKKSEEKYNSAAPKYQEIEGPPVARKILSSFPIDESIINEICDIIGNHHSPGNINSYNFKLLYDADWLVNLPNAHDLSKNSKEEIKETIDKLYLSQSGKEKAKEIFIKKGSY
ncbi:MAG: HD domain-containing protein [bacterium]